MIRQHKKMNENKCTHCKSILSYNEKYDSYYCPKCMYWIENICPNKECEYCKNRPKYPQRGA